MAAPLKLGLKFNLILPPIFFKWNNLNKRQLRGELSWLINMNDQLINTHLLISNNKTYATYTTKCYIYILGTRYNADLQVKMVQQMG